jgi:Amt family ammonium transporter
LKERRAAIWLGLLASLLLPTVVSAQDEISPGDTAWMLTASAMVLLMTPGLAFFYGGLVRRKNVLSILMQCFMCMGLMTILWVLFGFSLAFGESVLGGFIGGSEFFFLRGVGYGPQFDLAIPGQLFMIFQGMFAIITPALMVGAFAERMKFSAICVFCSLWLLAVYAPVCHWVWGGAEGFFGLGSDGALDFAGGTVVHINAGVSALVAALLLGPRRGYPDGISPPHNLPFAVLGTGLLWFGWFGFNAGSALEASGGAALAMVNTWVATACAALSWMFAEWIIKGKPSMLGAASGAVAGLVAITPAAGFVGVMGAIIIGLLAGIVCLWGVNGLKKLLGVDDSLDVFGIHGVGGILGAILTGVFVDPALGGTGVYDYVANKVGDFDMTTQVISQLWGVGTVIVWSGVVSIVAYKLVDIVIGLRVPEEEEREGLDLTSHGETAYHH